MKRSRKRTRTLILAIMLIAVGLAALYARQRVLSRAIPEPSLLTMTLQPKDFALKILANGELQSAESTAIAVPPVPVERLRIASVVADGRYINKGDVLVEFDPTELDLKALEHRSTLDIANQKINRGELAVGVEKSDIEKDKKLAELELEKINEFLPKNEQLYTRRQILEGQLDKDYTAKKIIFADASLELKGKVYSLDEAILMLERQQANSKINQVEKALTSLKLVSPTAGIVVYNRPGYFFGNQQLMPGKVVFVGMPLFNLVNPNKMEAKCFVLEKDAGELRVEQPVKVTLDPYPGVEFTGKIKNIDNLARPLDYESPIKYFQTIVTLNNTDPNLMKPGVKLKAEIIAGELKSVIVVPRSAIVKKESGFIAYVQKAPDQFTPVSVNLGQGDLIQVVITAGLQQGQVLALNPPDVKQDFSPGAKKAAASDDKPKTP
ncbi:MAG: HlyD family efflux transporter periplasmic adaptor subunit [Acidobacteriota bacterium]